MLDVGLEGQGVDIEVVARPILLSPIEAEEHHGDGLRLIVLSVVEVGEGEGEERLEGELVLIAAEDAPALVDVLGHLDLVLAVAGQRIGGVELGQEEDVLLVDGPMLIEVGDALLLEVGDLLLDLGEGRGIVHLAGEEQSGKVVLHTLSIWGLRPRYKLPFALYARTAR